MSVLPMNVQAAFDGAAFRGVEPTTKEETMTKQPEKGHVGRWLSAAELSERHGYHPSFFSNRARQQLIRTKGEGKATVYSSVDAAAVAEACTKSPYKRGGVVEEPKAQPSINPAKVSKIDAITYVIMGVEMGIYTKEEAFDKIALVLK